MDNVRTGNQVSNSVNVGLSIKQDTTIGYNVNTASNFTSSAKFSGPTATSSTTDSIINSISNASNNTHTTIDSLSDVASQAGNVAKKTLSTAYNATAPAIKTSVRSAYMSMSRMGSKSDSLGGKAIGYAGRTVTTSRMVVRTAKTSARLTYKTTTSSARMVKSSARLLYKGGKKIATVATSKRTEAVVNALWKKLRKGVNDSVIGKIKKSILNALKNLFKNPKFWAVAGVIFLIIMVTLICGGAFMAITEGPGEAIGGYFEEVGDNLKGMWDGFSEGVRSFGSNALKTFKAFFTGEVTVNAGETMSVDDYMNDAIVVHRCNLLEQINKEKKRLTDEEGYDKVYVYSTNGALNSQDVDSTGVMTVDKYVEIIEPIWKAGIFGLYGSDFKPEEAENLTAQIFDTMTSYKVLPFSTVVDEQDNVVEAYVYCDGTKDAQSIDKGIPALPGCTHHTEQTEGAQYGYCMGHKEATIMVCSMDNFDEVVDNIFGEKIRTLEGKGNKRTKKESEQLENLHLAKELAESLFDEYKTK